MAGKNQRADNLPYLGDDVLFKIFVKCHPKTVGRLRTLSKQWNLRLIGKLFAREHWKENEDRDENVVIEYGHTWGDEKSHWCVGIDACDGAETNLEIPFEIMEHGSFSVIGSNYGNLCIRYSTSGEETELMVWNPITKEVVRIEDQAHNHWGYSQSVYAFAYLDDSWECRVIYLYKSLFLERRMNWMMWNSKNQLWNRYGQYDLDVNKVGPTSVAIGGIVYWIGWSGFFHQIPSHLIGFHMTDATFFEDEIPADNQRSFHTISKFKQGLGFISYEDVGFEREVNVWSVSLTENRKFSWEKIIHVNSFGIPHSPNILHGYEIISVLDNRFTSTGSNGSHRTEIVISKMKGNGGSRKIIYHQGWRMSLFVKTYTMHRNGLYKIIWNPNK